MHIRRLALVVIIVILQSNWQIDSLGQGTPDLGETIRRAQAHLAELQNDQDYWAGKVHLNSRELAYFILTVRYIGLPDEQRVQRSAEWLLAHQSDDGSWGFLDLGGAGDTAITAINILALEEAGVPSDHPALIRAREFVASHGGFSVVDPFTEVFYALFDRISWDEVDQLAPPIEIMLIPREDQRSIYNQPTWIREVLVPLSAIKTLNSDQDLTPIQQAALREAELYVIQHQLEDGSWYTDLPTVFMMIALHELDPQLHLPRIQAGQEWLHRFQDAETGYQYSFELAVWDTAFAVMALADSGIPASNPVLTQAGIWLMDAQTVAGGNLWSTDPSGGWSYSQYNILYPDNDDTALAILALQRITMRSTTLAYKKRIAVERGRRWLLHMQNDDGGWASFSKNEVSGQSTGLPSGFEDSSVADVTGHVLSALGGLRYDVDSPAVQRAIAWLKTNQTEVGSWYGRWGLCYLYGTSAVLQGLSAVGEDMQAPYIQEAVAWLKHHQNDDGGWGEEFDYFDSQLSLIHTRFGASTVEQTAWVLMGLMAAGEPPTSAVLQRGITYLQQQQRPDGSWYTEAYTNQGFNPYRDTLYPVVFPLMALGMYAELTGQTVALSATDASFDSLYWPSSQTTYEMANAALPEVVDEQGLFSVLEPPDLQVALVPDDPIALLLSNMGQETARQVDVRVLQARGEELETWRLEELSPGASTPLVLQVLPEPGTTFTVTLGYQFDQSWFEQIETLDMPPMISPSPVDRLRALGIWSVPVALLMAFAFYFRDVWVNPELGRYILKNLRRNQLRIWLTLLGIIVGTAGLGATMALGSSFQQQLIGELGEWARGGEVFILPYELQIEVAPPAEAVTSNPKAVFNDEDVRRIAELPNVRAVTPIINTRAAAEYQGSRVEFRIKLVDGDTFQQASGSQLASGRFFKSWDHRVVLLGNRLAHEAFSTDIPVGAWIHIGGHEYQVVGILESVGGISGSFETMASPDVLAFVPLMACSDFVSRDSYDELQAVVQDQSRIEDTVAAIEETLAAHHLNENLDVQSAAAIVDQVAALPQQFSLVLLIISLFSLLVGGIGIMNIMLVNVLERRKEIGVLKALGAKNKIIMQIFLVEAGGTGLVGGFIGCGIAYLVFVLMYRIIDFAGPFNPLILIVALTFAVFTSLMSGIYPAYRASRLDPVLTLRNE